MSRIREIVAQLEIPVIAAPMFLVSNPAMALACCAEGVMGNFRRMARDRETFSSWLVEMREGMKRLRDARGRRARGTLGGEPRGASLRSAHGGRSRAASSTRCR